MAVVTVTELNHHTREVLDRVRAGEDLVITDRGRPIARLVPEVPDRWSQLISSGRVKPATASGPLDLDPARTGPSTSEVIDELRQDRW
ncbi:MAG: type II toxin-antitoxin system prevent-host-death family antitoxin [Frankiaceae bacterium]|jgi:prevent-host-death family protein|nr:type II toxin-antitoxin system prevent-host-death family antitoxin [Frankiaceae bacterium]